MLKFPIIDTHVHLWDPREITYEWQHDLPALNRPFLPADYREACGEHEVEKMVFLECDVGAAQHLKEADWVTSLVANESRISGIVAGASLEKGEAIRDALAELKKNPLVKGVRRITQGEDDRAFCLRPDFVKGVQLLPEYGFSFDICIMHEQLANTTRLVELCPDVSFILDHIAKPDIKNGMLDPWKEELQRLAACPNVVCKLSGLVTEGDHENWTREDLVPYIEHVVETFGFDRVLFGGDWPVVTLASPLHQWMDTVQEILRGVDESNLRKLFRENAESTYRL